MYESSWLLWNYFARTYQITLNGKHKMSTTIFENIITLLDANQARYRVIEHASAGRSADVAKVRGTRLEQGAKALVCHAKGNGIKQYVLAVLPAHRKADLSLLAQKMGGLRASLASPAETMELTQCVFGTVPAFSFHPQLKLVVDPMLFDFLPEIVFSAASLERSILLNAEDYRRIVQPELVEFSIEMSE